MKKQILCLSLFLSLTANLIANFGVFPVAYGVKAQGLAGAVTAYPQDSLAPFTNPAGGVWLEGRYDVGVSAPYFKDRGYTYTLLDGSSYRQSSTDNLFFIPYGSVTIPVADNQNVGIATYFLGPNVRYKDSPIVGQGAYYLESQQLQLAPNWSIGFADNYSVGVAVIGVVSRAKVAGLQTLTDFSVAPNYFTNKGYAYNFGAGVRVGVLARFLDHFWIGAAYCTKVYSSKVNGYKGLLVNGGSLDVPANWSLGLRYEASDDLNLSFDYQVILNKGVDSLSNPFQNITFTSPNLGSKNGPGFGWNNQRIFRFGADYQFTERFNMKLGYAFSNRLFNNQQLDFNELTESIIRNYITAGTTIDLGNCQELSISYFYGFHASESGPSGLTALDVSQVTLINSMHSVGISYGKKF